MADLNLSIQTYLAADSTIVSGGYPVRPDNLDINDDPMVTPVIVFWNVTGSSTDTIDGTFGGIAEARVTIACYAKTRKIANQVSEAVRLAMIDFRGTRSGLKIRNCSVDSGESHDTDSPTGEYDSVRYITSRDYRVTYIEDN